MVLLQVLLLVCGVGYIFAAPSSNSLDSTRKQMEQFDRNIQRFNQLTNRKQQQVFVRKPRSVFYPISFQNSKSSPNNHNALFHGYNLNYPFYFYTYTNTHPGYNPSTFPQTPTWPVYPDYENPEEGTDYIPTYSPPGIQPPVIPADYPEGGANVPVEPGSNDAGEEDDMNRIPGDENGIDEGGIFYGEDKGVNKEVEFVPMYYKY